MIMTVADIKGGMSLEEVRSQEIVARWEDIALEKVVRRESLRLLDTCIGGSKY